MEENTSSNVFIISFLYSLDVIFCSIRRWMILYSKPQNMHLSWTDK